MLAFPKYLRIGIADRCSLKCSFCPRDEYFSSLGNEGTFMPYEKLALLEIPIREAKVIDLTGFGEPTIHPKFIEIIKFIYTHSKSERPICITTNSTGFTAKKVQILRDRISSIAFSVNSATEESMKRMMGYNLEKMKDKITLYVKNVGKEDARRSALHFVTDVNNVSEMPALVEMADQLGIGRVRFDEFRVIREEMLHLSLLNCREVYAKKLEEAREIGKRFGVEVVGKDFFSEPARLFSPELMCKSPFIETNIDTYGNLTPCCYTGQSLGNVFEDGFEAIWFGKAYTKLREERFLGACQSCAMFQRLEDAHLHVGVPLNTRPSIAPILEKWEAWRIQHQQEKQADLLQPDLRLYEYLAKAVDGGLETIFAEKVQEWLLSDFTRHYFSQMKPSGKPFLALRELDDEFRRQLAHYHWGKSFSSKHEVIEMSELFFGMGWFVDRNAMQRGHRLIVNGWEACVFAKTKSLREIRIASGKTGEGISDLSVRVNGVVFRVADFHEKECSWRSPSNNPVYAEGDRPIHIVIASRGRSDEPGYPNSGYVVKRLELL